MIAHNGDDWSASRTGFCTSCVPGPPNMNRKVATIAPAPENGSGGDDYPLLDIEDKHRRADGESREDPDRPDEDPEVEADRLHQTHPQRVPKCAASQRHGDEVEQVRQHREQ